METKRSHATSPCPCGESLKSDRSMGLPENFRAAGLPPGEGNSTKRASLDQDPELELDRRDFEAKLLEFVKSNSGSCWKLLSGDAETNEEQEEQEEDTPSGAAAKEAFLLIALHVLKTMKKDAQVFILEQRLYGDLLLFQRKLKSSMRSRYQRMTEGTGSPETGTATFNKIYTDLYVLDGVARDINSDHEVRQLETAINRPRSQEVSIGLEDILKDSPQQDGPVRTVLTQGMAGIGKTVLAQKLMLDWAEDKSNQEVEIIFSLPFRELNLLRNQRMSLTELLCHFCPELRGSALGDLSQYRVLLVLDGLDECRLRLDFSRPERCCDATESRSVDVLLTELLSGNLLPGAQLWITTRPAAAACVPPRLVDRVTEVRGFSDSAKERYLRTKIGDENLAKRVIAHVKSVRSLYIMCHVPVFCWMSSIVLGKMFLQAGSVKMPKTLTHMYLHFMLYQSWQRKLKYREEQLADSGALMALGRLAFQELEKGNLIFYEEDLRECGLEVKEASVYSGLCTQLFREESWMQQKVFCFVHLSVQECLAALYVHVTYTEGGVNLMAGESGRRDGPHMPLSHLHAAAVDRALRSPNGHLDLFLRFLLGLSMDSSRHLLQGLRVEPATCPPTDRQETIAYVQRKVRETPHTDRCVNLFHCLSELEHDSVVQQVQSFLESGRDPAAEGVTAAQWAGLVFVLLTSQEHLELFELRKFSRTEEGLRRLLPVLKASRTAKLNDCRLRAACCPTLSEALSSASSELRDLDLSDNRLSDAGAELLCSGLQSPHCRLTSLTLNRCDLSQGSCVGLSSVLGRSSSRLLHLDLSDNDLQDTGVQQLCSGLKEAGCSLQTLRLSFCCVTEVGCGYLASALRSNPSHLTELDLSYNHLGDGGVRLVSEALEGAAARGVGGVTKLRADHNQECWFKPGLDQYACHLTLDLNTAHRLLIVSEDHLGVTQGQEELPYPDHPDRFDYWTQVLLQPALPARSYWEVEWEGNWAGVGVAYASMGRKGVPNSCVMGYNPASWSLHCSAHGYAAYHDIKSTAVAVPSAGCRRVGVFLDRHAGLLSFYRVSAGRSLTHLHTFRARFDAPLHAGLRVWDHGSSVRLCQI